MKSKKSKRTTAPTVRQLADSLGVSRQLVQYHLSSGKAPSLSDPLDNWVEYLAAYGREGSASAKLRAAIAEQRVRWLKAKADREELDNATRRRQVIDRSDVFAFIAELNNAFFGGLQRMAQELPSTLKGKSELMINEEVSKQIEHVRRDLAAKREQWRRQCV